MTAPSALSPHPQPPSMLSPDGRLLFVTASLRNLATGALSVVLGLYLATLGFSIPAIGATFTLALIATAGTTAFLTHIADRCGRHRILLLTTTLTAIGSFLLLISDNVAIVLFAACIGMLSPSGKDNGPCGALEQAILPQTTAHSQRTAVFSYYNLASSLASAIGALFTGLPAFLGFSRLTGFQTILAGYVALILLTSLLYTRLSPAIERHSSGLQSTASSPAGLQRSRPIIFRLAALFAVDAFAGAFIVQSLLAYWFSVRFHLDIRQLSAVFFATNLCSALSFLAAPPLARRIGLLNTMVFTHLPSNVLLLLISFMPNGALAITVLLIRNLLSQMDVPTRQSYTMAIVDPSERAAAAGITSVARSVGTATGPLISGVTLTVPALGLPFLVAGSLKIAYDLTIFALFRHIHPPEEER